MTRRSNCLIWALLLYLRRRGGGRSCYVSIRGSWYGRFPHFIYTERRSYGLRMVGYVPLDPKIKTCPPPLFHGRVKWGDKPPVR